MRYPAPTPFFCNVQRGFRGAALRLLLISCVSACAPLPVMDMALVNTASAASNVDEATIVKQDGVMSAAGGQAKIREAQSEGKSQLLAHHLGMLTQSAEFVTADNEVHLLVDGPATFKAMFADLAQARKSIQMESYIFEDESLGVTVAQLLKEKAARGVQVHLIYDAVGSLSTPREFFDDLARSGVAVCEFNPISPLVNKLNNRDHRKILIVDSGVALTGGINISGVYSAGSSSILKSSRHKEEKETLEDGAKKPPEKGWRDTHIRIQGPAVADFSTLFADTWQRQKCDKPPTAVKRQATRDSGDRLVAVLGSKPGDAEPRIYRTLLTAIGGAKRSIHMTMSYFVPDPQTLDYLTAAARRGVDVQLVLQGKSDSTLVLRAGQSHYQQLLDAGVIIYERTDTLLHSKTAVIDGVWSTVGSSNLDWRSFLHNDEVSAIVLGADFGAEMEQLFAQDVARSQRITSETWAERGISRRFVESVGRLFEYWL